MRRYLCESFRDFLRVASAHRHAKSRKGPRRTLIDAERLVFVDEMGTHTSLAPLYAYAPIGERAYFEIPRNRGKNTTLPTSLHQEGIGPPMAVQGVTTARVC